MFFWCWSTKFIIFNDLDMGLVLLYALLLSIQLSTTYGIKDVPAHKIEVLNGETIYLPCNVSTFDNDEVLLILWYREDKGTPIYSVDARGGFSKAAKRWSDESVLGDRAYFILDKEPGILSIENAKNTDTGVYRCRVDFAKAQTRNIKFKVTVIVQPKQIIIRDDADVERSTVVGPYSEGDIITLKCEVIGGKPLPKINWYRDGIQLDTDTVLLPGDTHVQSEITLGPLGREDLNSKLVCKASNHARATPIETSVQIDMNFAPLNIRLLGAHQPLSAGRRYDLLCQSAGSRPPAVITWWQNGMRLEKTTETTSSDGNQTTSTLSITLNKSDAGKYLSCKAYNHIISGEPLEDGWKLDIQYIPEAYVRLGSSLDPNSIREASDVYFDCLVLAHPPVYRVEWRLNGRALPHNISQGVIISNHSLVLQGVTRATAGNYSCVGYNEEGEGISPPFQLNILFAPTCAANQARIYGVAKQEDAKIKCTVDANPPDVDFTWTFNNSAESIDVATNHIARSGTSSVVTYTPITELDYGTLLCIATNKIGRQRVPCVFHIIAAGRPDQVHNCTLNNISMTSLTVTCSEGFNGGLPQLFILEIVDIHSNELKSNITSTYPRFTVAALSPGSVYMLSIYAYNSKGRSDATNLNAAMLRMPEKQLTSEQVERAHAELMFSPMISLTIGLTLAVTVALFAVVLALRIPCSNARRRPDLPNENMSRSGSPGPSDKSYGSKEVDDSDDRNPDVVPDTPDPDEQLGFERRKQHIATIDATNSPTRDVMCKTPPPQNFSASEMTLYTHNMGYCTLRNGMPIAAPPGALQISMAPHVYSKSITQCTLPRGSNQAMWGGYAAEGPLVRHVVPPGTSMHQMTMPSTSKQLTPMQLAQHANELASSTTSASSMGSNIPTLGKTIVLQHITQSQRGRICMGIGNPGMHNVEANCMSDDEATVQTPLVFKKESTV